MGEDTAVGVAVVGSCSVVAGLVELRHELAHGKCHRVAQHEGGEPGEYRVAEKGVAGADLCDDFDPLVADERDDCVHHDQEHEDGGDDSGDPAHELLTAELEDAHECGCKFN